MDFYPELTQVQCPFMESLKNNFPHWFIDTFLIGNYCYVANEYYENIFKK